MFSESKEKILSRKALSKSKGLRFLNKLMTDDDDEEGTGNDLRKRDTYYGKLKL